MVRCFVATLALAITLSGSPVRAEPYHEPQVRYILADIQLGGSVDYYGKWAKEENDPDSKRAVKEWQAGTRVKNIAAFERKTVEGKFGKGLRIVYQGTNRTINGMDVVLSKDLNYRQGDVRYHLADLTIGLPPAALVRGKMTRVPWRLSADGPAAFAPPIRTILKSWVLIIRDNSCTKERSNPSTACW